MAPAIIAENLSFGFHPKERILNQVSFAVDMGTFIGVIGPNGGGKTTLLKLLLGLLTPWEGTITINSIRPPAPKVGYVPQAFQFDRSFPITALEVVQGGRARNLSRFGRWRDEDIAAATAALERVGLPHLASHPFGTLSGGQAQRVLIARALASEPSVLLLDEPTSSSDPVAEAAILDTIRSLQHQMTILMVTHNLSAILSQVEGVLCVQGGAVLLHPKDVCEHFALGLYHIPLLETPEHHLTLQKKNAL